MTSSLPPPSPPPPPSSTSTTTRLPRYRDRFSWRDYRYGTASRDPSAMDWLLLAAKVIAVLVIITLLLIWLIIPFFRWVFAPVAHSDRPQVAATYSASPSPVPEDTASAAAEPDPTDSPTDAPSSSPAETPTPTPTWTDTPEPTTTSKPATRAPQAVTSVRIDLLDACRQQHSGSVGWRTVRPHGPQDVVCLGSGTQVSDQNLDVQGFCDSHGGGIATPGNGDTWTCVTSSQVSNVNMTTLCQWTWFQHGDVKGYNPGHDINRWRCKTPTILGTLDLNAYCADRDNTAGVSGLIQAKATKPDKADSWTCVRPS